MVSFRTRVTYAVVLAAAAIAYACTELAPTVPVVDTREAVAVRTATVTYPTVQITPTPGPMVVGDSLKLQAKLYDGTSTWFGRQMKWTTNDPSKLKIAVTCVGCSAGSVAHITALAAGTPTLTATTQSKTFQTVTVTITPPVVVTPPPPPPAPAPPPPPPPPPIIGAALCQTPYTRLVNVSTATQLKAALTGAVPGDHIQLADGTYTGAGELRVRRTPGTATQPIVVCGGVNAVINAGSLTNTDGLSLIGAAYWTFSGFSITNGLFGVYADSSPHLVLDHLTIHAIGQEAVSLKQFSHHSIVQYNTIYDTGRSIAEYGEGVYVGTAYSQWVGGVPDKTDSVLVQRNTFGPNVRAEAIDVKEATTGTHIFANAFDGTGEVESQGSGESGWPNSPVILQGMNALVDSNTVVHPLIAAFRVVTHGTVMTGTGNVFANNTVNAGGALYGFLIQSGSLSSTNTVKCNNVVTNYSGSYSKGVACTP